MALTIDGRGTKINDTSFSVPITKYTKVFLYVTYSQGDETNIVFTFKVKDTDHDSYHYLATSGATYTLLKKSHSIDTSGSWLIEVDVPSSSDILISEISFIAGTTGTVDIFVGGGSTYV